MGCELYCRNPNTTIGQNFYDCPKRALLFTVIAQEPRTTLNTQFYMRSFKLLINPKL